jgi:hypothetical protein
LNRTYLGACAVLLAAMLLMPVVATTDERPTTGWQATMQHLFSDLSVVFYLSLDDNFQDPANRDEILTSLYALAANAEQLGAHGTELNATNDFLRRSLVRDANEAVMRFRQGQFEGSRFLLDQLMTSCFTCHSRLPAKGRFDPGERFLDQIDFESLIAGDQVRVQVATRQFEAALSTYEKMFSSRTVSPSNIANSGAFEDYLKICVRVEKDCNRAAATFETIRRREGVPLFLDSRLERWVEDLKEIGKNDSMKESDPLDRGRELLRDAQYRCAFPNDPQGTVLFVAASGYLHRYLKTSPSDPKRLAEIYYLLGVAESHVSTSYWWSETDCLLENAIRSAPSSVYARMAYNFLEEYTASGYTGSSGVNIPPQVQERLDELRSLLLPRP